MKNEDEYTGWEEDDLLSNFLYNLIHVSIIALLLGLCFLYGYYS